MATDLTGYPDSVLEHALDAVEFLSTTFAEHVGNGLDPFEVDVQSALSTLRGKRQRQTEMPSKK
jgi:hypothetical protein